MLRAASVVALAAASLASFVHVDQEMSWTDAREYCRTHHHDLASIHSASENAEVAALCPVWCFLGGSDVDQEGTWTWSDGSAWDYENWDTGQPNNLNGPEDYLNMWGAAPASNREHGKWNDLRPEGPHTFVCRDTPASNTFTFQAGRCYPQSEAPVINTAGLMSSTLRRTGTPQECYDYCTGNSGFNIMGLDLRPTGGQDCQCNPPSVKSRER